MLRACPSDLKPFSTLRALDVQLYRLGDDLSGALILPMLVFSPWAFGTTEPWSIWCMNWGGFALGIAAAATVAGGTSLLDSALAVGFAGAMVTAIASSGARNPLSALLRRGPLAFYGRISYGLYMVHISVFIFFGWFDLRMDPYGTAGNLAVVAFRMAASTAVAAALWYGFESQVLKLKRYF